MKRMLKLVTPILAATFFVVGANTAAAGCDTGNSSKAPGTPMSGVASPSRANPEYGGFGYGQASETGGPPAGAPAGKSVTGMSNEEIPVVQAGGLEYRLGIDTE